jgi:hypothetical protein
MSSSAPRAKAAAGPTPATVTGRRRKRQPIASEKHADGPARGSTVITSTRCPGRSGLGKAYRSQMSPAGPAMALGPEK